MNRINFSYFLSRSVGVVVYYLLTGESPFWNESKEHTFLNVCQLNISYPDHLFQDISMEAIAFIKRLIQKNPRFGKFLFYFYDRF